MQFNEERNQPEGHDDDGLVLLENELDLPGFRHKVRREGIEEGGIEHCNRNG